MTPFSIFLLRLALSFGAGYILSVFYFGGFSWRIVLILACVMLGSAYVFEAIRRRGGDKGRSG